MRIGIQCAGDLPIELAEKCVESIRKHMDCPIVHLTDLTTPKFPFADEVQRIDEDNLVLARYRHLSTIEGDCLSLDYDTIVKKDVSDVFDRDFDVALTKRKLAEGKFKMLSLSQPHNAGVIFTRNRDFWKLCIERFSQYPPNNGWMMGQICISECSNIYKDDFNIIELDGELYNYTPDSPNEDLSSRFIVHYKGPRKHWMVNTESVFNEGKRVMEIAKEGELFFTQDHPNFKEIIAEQKLVAERKNGHH